MAAGEAPSEPLAAGRSPPPERRAWLRPYATWFHFGFSRSRYESERRAPEQEEAPDELVFTEHPPAEQTSTARGPRRPPTAERAGAVLATRSSAGHTAPPARGEWGPQHSSAMAGGPGGPGLQQESASSPDPRGPGGCQTTPRSPQAEGGSAGARREASSPPGAATPSLGSWRTRGGIYLPGPL